MRNLTITVEEQAARWTRIWAGKNNSSVSRLVGQLLKKHMLEEKHYQRAMNEFLSRGPVRLKRSGGYPGREELHERPGVR